MMEGWDGDVFKSYPNVDSLVNLPGVRCVAYHGDEGVLNMLISHEELREMEDTVFFSTSGPYGEPSPPAGLEWLLAELHKPCAPAARN
jgi:hypothetical protein